MRVLGYIFAGLLTLIVLLLLSTVGADIRYSDAESSVRVHFNGFTVARLPLIPEPTPTAVKKKEPKRKKPKRREEKPKAEELTSLFTGTGEVLSYAKRTLGIFYQRVIKKIVVSQLKIHISVATDDAVRTTVLFGNLSGLVNAVCATLSYMVTLKRCDINIVPDYASMETRANMRAVFKLRILRLLIVVAALYPMYKELKERKNKNEQSSDQRSNLQHHGEAD